MKKNSIRNHQGSAILIALVIMMVLMMLSLALLAVSYSLFSTANKQQNTEQCKEIAQSLSKELEAQIVGVSFMDENGKPSYQVQQQAANNGEYPLWFYLRYNVWQSNWPYYNAEEYGHTANYAFRYFDISSNDTGIDTSVLDDTSVMIYWESEMGADTMAKNNTPLTIQVTCTKGKQKATITSYYTLEMEDVTETSYSDVDGSIGGDDTGNSYVNPSNNIYEYPAEIWNWTLSERE